MQPADNSLRAGVLPLARPTFDTGLARSKLRSMFQLLDRCGIETLGPRRLLLDDASITEEFNAIAACEPDAWIILQTTFTDAAATAAVAEQTEAPVVIWAVREPRTGGRLRLNSLCGLNLASHALGLRGRPFSWVYSDPELLSPGQINDLMRNGSCRRAALLPAVENDAGRRAAESLKGARIGRVGSHPAGFDTCGYDPGQLSQIFGIDVQTVSLETVFDAARSIESAGGGADDPPDLTGLDDLDPAALQLSLRLAPALKSLAQSRRLDAVSIRCWPECFTEYGGAVCGPVSMLAEDMLPCACESDVYGAVTQLAVQNTAGAPVFLADIVDADFDDNSVVVWHCGQAPLSMCDPQHSPAAAVHSNRRLPLLCQFPLKPGQVTLARISKASGEHKMVLAAAKMLRRPLAFSGTAGVLRFERPARQVIADIIDNGLEHHFVIAYGDLRRQLHGVAAALGLKVLEL